MNKVDLNIKIEESLQIAINPESLSEQLDAIVMDTDILWNTDKGKEISNAISSNPNCPPQHLSTLYQYPIDELQKFLILKNPNCPDKIMTQTVEGDDMKLKEAVLKNPRLSPNIILGCVKSESIGSKLIVAISERSDLDESIQEIINLKIKFAQLKKDHQDKSGYVWLEESLLSVTDWGQNIFESLYMDQDRHIRSAIAKNPSLPENMIDELISDSESSVKLAVLSNPSCNKDILIKAGKDNENYSSSLIRKAVALNMKTPKQVIDKLIKDEYRWVRQAAASHPSIEKQLISDLMKTGDRYVLTGLTANANCTADIQKKIKDMLGDKQKYPVQTDTYILGFDCSCYPSESVAGDVEIDEIIDAIVGHGDWSGYMWDNSWYDYCGYYHTYGMHDTARDIEYPDGSRESIHIADNPDDDEYNAPTVEEIGSELSPGSFFTTGVSYEKTGSGWENWMKYTAEIEYELKIDKIIPYYEAGNVTSYEHDENDSFESDENYSTTGKGSDFCLYMVTKKDGVVEIYIEDIIDEIIEEGLDETNEEDVRSFLKKNYSGE